ncbi:threonine/serine exporter family protein [Caloramator sp. mosi_1]|uniref:threonine/serine exporter family protein n=1 Tax=Caloramator sp. mosi_1 TaxID=3023090 RepID=UPI003FCD42DB
MLLSSGAEIYRVEDTITRICNSYGVECECFVMPTGFSLTVRNKNGEVLSNVKRIRHRSVDLHRVEMVNTFSRRLLNERASYKEAMQELNSIKICRILVISFKLYHQVLLPLDLLSSLEEVS